MLQNICLYYTDIAVQIVTNLLLPNEREAWVTSILNSLEN